VALPSGDWQAEVDAEERRRPARLDRGDSRAPGRDRFERDDAPRRFERDGEARRPGERWEREGREERRSLRVPPRAARTPAAGRKGGARSDRGDRPFGRPFEKRGRR
ncbi:MAG: hypothetical protein ACRDHP_04520, partial [Ktedonobacterales bacterium]